MLDLDKACQGQLAAVAGGSERSCLSDAALKRRTADVAVTRHQGFGPDLAALPRLVDRVSPGYEDESLG